MALDRTRLIGAAFIASVTLAAVSPAEQRSDVEGTARGFPVMRDSAGKKLADGDFSQWLEKDQLHVRIRYDFSRGDQVEEKAAFRQRPRLIQDAWSLRELRNGKTFRHFEVDFGSRSAKATKLDDDELKKWSDTVDVEPGRTFAGFGFTLAIKSLRERLVKGERIELRAIGFTPKPRAVSVEISHGGLDQMQMSGRLLRGDRFVIHPRIPWIADLFLDVPDTQIWLTNPEPAGFLRWEGPLAEPSDPVIRVDLLPGGESGPAKPIGTSGRRRFAVAARGFATIARERSHGICGGEWGRRSACAAHAAAARLRRSSRVRGERRRMEPAIGLEPMTC